MIKLSVRNIELAYPILQLTPAPPLLRLSGAEAGFLLAYVTKSKLDRACIIAASIALKRNRIAESTLVKETTEKLKEFSIADRIAGIAVRGLKKMGILRGDKILRTPKGKERAISFYDDMLFLDYISKKMKGFVWFKEETLLIDGVALAYAYLKSELNTTLRAARLFADELSRQFVPKGVLKKRHANLLSKFMTMDVEVCNDCLSREEEIAVRSCEVVPALHRLLLTKTGKAEVKLLRRNRCKYPSGKVKEKVTARDARKNLPKTVKRVSIIDPELLSVADFPYGSFVAGKLCGLAISHALSRLRKEDAIAADAILQAAYNISREELVISFRNVAKQVLDIFRATLST